MDLRSSLSFATDRPRYSVSRTAVELLNFSSSSATVASLFAMATPLTYETRCGCCASPSHRPEMKKAPCAGTERVERQLNAAIFSFSPARAVSVRAAHFGAVRLENLRSTCWHADDRRSWASTIVRDGERMPKSRSQTSACVAPHDTAR